MTKKDFEQIANHMKHTKPIEVRGLEEVYKPAMAQWERDIESLSHALSLLNPRFDCERFINACGGGKLHQE